MPISRIISSDLVPTYVAKPDQRFATSALSVKYRDKAVKGEFLTDKTSGEWFIKRPEDGRVVSFAQTHKYVHDILLEMRVVLNNTPGFLYPPEDDYDACFSYKDYDLVTINDDLERSILKYDSHISNAEDSTLHQLHFNLSRQTNGFFLRLTSRDVDKPIINWLTNQYNKLLENYEGDDPAYLKEHNKFVNIEKWKDSNATISFNVTGMKDGVSRTFSYVDYVRINEDMCVKFPETTLANHFPDGYDIGHVEITGITYEKIHFMFEHRHELGDEFMEGLHRFVYPDKKILVRYCTIGSFINRAEDVEMLGNDFLVCLLDMPYFYRYIMKMSALKESADVILSPFRPSNEDWPTNGIWAEHVRDVYENGLTIHRQCEVDLDALEMYLAHDIDYKNLNITENEFEKENIYLHDEYADFYSKKQIDRKIDQLDEYISDKQKEIVTMDKDNVTPEGMVLEPVREEVIEEPNPEEGNGD